MVVGHGVPVGARRPLLHHQALPEDQFLNGKPLSEGLSDSFSGRAGPDGI